MSSLNLVCSLIQHQVTKCAFVDYLLQHGIDRLDPNAQEITLSMMLARLELFVPCRGIDDILLRYLQHPQIPVHLKQITQQVLMSWMVQQDQYNPHEETAAAMLSALEIQPTVKRDPMVPSNGHHIAFESVEEKDRTSKRRRTDAVPTMLDTEVAANASAQGGFGNTGVTAWMTETIMSAMADNSWVGDLLTQAPPLLSSSSFATAAQTIEHPEKMMSTEAANGGDSTIAMVVAADRNDEQSSMAIETRNNTTAEDANKAHAELLTRCRAHRTQILRALGTTSTSGVGGGSASGRSKAAVTANASMSTMGQGLTPKAQQQLSSAACGLIVQIADDAQTWMSSLGRGRRGVINTPCNIPYKKRSRN